MTDKIVILILISIFVLFIAMYFSVLEDQTKTREILNKHSEILNKHSEILNKHSEILNKLSEDNRNHTEILNKHSEILNKYSEILNKLSEDNRNHTEILNKLSEDNRNHTEILNKLSEDYRNYTEILNKLSEDNRNHTEILNKILEIIDRPNKAQDLVGEILLKIKTKNGHASGAKIIYNDTQWIVTNKHVVFDNYKKLFNDTQNVCRKQIETVTDSNDTIIKIDEDETYAHKTLDILIIKVKEPNGKFAEISSEDLKMYQVLYGKYSNIGSIGNVLYNHVDGNTYSNTPGYGGWSGSPLTDGQKMIAIHKGGVSNYKHNELYDQLLSFEELKEDDESDNIDKLVNELKINLNKIENIPKNSTNKTIESIWKDFSYLIKKSFKINMSISSYFGRNPKSIIIASSKIFQIEIESGHVNVNTIPICSKKKNKDSKS